MPKQPEPHSADQFGPQRDFWWNQDFLALMAARWRLGEVSSLADIGCGMGHWSRLLYPWLHHPARLIGIDREARWVREASTIFRKVHPEAPPGLIAFGQGDAAALPLADNRFEVVTCQTLLMHLERPLDALQEMRRVLRPGGLLVCVEPSNLWNRLAFNSITAEEPIASVTKRFEFWLRYQRGKMKAGQGDDSIGDLLPGIFAQIGMREIMVYQSDRAFACYPPYDTPAQKCLLEQERHWQATQTGPWNRDEVRRRVLLGGAQPSEFDELFDELVEQARRQDDAIAQRNFHAAWGGLTYLVSGRK
jgi:ubiquinone/menaquinone biosynthesis C-methylase UbiE